MFEKLKEYALYIILWLIALWALAYAYLNTTNTQKGSEVIDKVQDVLINAVSKNEKVIAKTTVVDHISDLSGTAIGQYKIDTSKVYFMNIDWDTAAVSWTLTWATVAASADTTDKGLLQLHMMPNEKVKWNMWTYESATATENTAQTAADVTFELTSKHVKAGTYDSDVAWSDIINWVRVDKNVNEIFRGFMAYGYVGFGTFAKAQDAKDFRDSYFSTWVVAAVDANNNLVFVELAR